MKKQLNVKRLKKFNKYGALVGPVVRLIIVQYDCRVEPPLPTCYLISSISLFYSSRLNLNDYL